MKKQAIMKTCLSYESDPVAHELHDSCMECMPFWQEYPTCVKCSKKLTRTLYCRNCRKYHLPAEKKKVVKKKVSNHNKAVAQVAAALSNKK